MAQLTKIRAQQLQPATATEGVTSLQLKHNAGIRLEQIAEGGNLIHKDGSVAMSGNLIVIPGIDSNHAVNKGQLDTAIANAGTANNTLADALAAETTARTAADTALGSRIDAADTAIAGEQTARANADSSLQSSVIAEATARQNADNSLQTSLDTEQAARIAAIAATNNAITAEANARADADVALQSTVDSLLLNKADKNGNASNTFAVGAPTQASHAANKAYVDGIAQGLDVKDSCRVATTGPITLNGLQVIDGVTVGIDDRILVKNQADNKENGVYVAAVGAWARSEDANNTPGAEFTAGLFTFVEEGEANIASGWVLASANSATYTIGGKPAIEIGVDDVTFSQFSGAGQVIAGTGLGKTGNTLSIIPTGVAAGSYTKVTVDAQGQVTVGENPTTIAGYGLTDAANIAGSQIQVFQVKDAAASFDAVNKGQLDFAVTTINNSIAATDGDVAAEAATRAAADTALQTNINSEATARTTAVTNEANARIAADAVLQSNITDEANTRAGNDTTLQNNIDGVTTALATETTARTNADTTLQNNINAANLAINAEATARDAADVILQTGIDTEVTARTNAVSALNTSLAAETTARTAADTTLQGNINSVIADLASEVTARETAVSTEEAARIAGDAALQTAINAAGTTLNTNYYTKAEVDSTFQALVNAAPAALDTLGEIATQLANDETAAAALTTALANETTRAQAAETLLTTNLGTTNTNLANEIATARAAESTLTINLAAEATTARAAEGVLTTNLATEVSDRTAAIAALAASNGVERTGNDFHVKLAADSGLIADASGLRIDISVITAARLRVRDPFSGVQDGTNVNFSVTVPLLEGSEQIFFNGMLQYPGAGNDYLISGQDITFAIAPTPTDRISINFTAA